MFEHWGDVTAEPGGVDYVEVTAGGVPALWATPKGCAQDRVLLCTHGGGYVTGSMYTHRKVYGHFAKAIGCRALIVHYRRAPEHVHPGPVDDVVASYRWLLDQGVKPQHIALTGDSAGGGLAITSLLRAREQGLPMPAATMPLSPWVDMEASGESFASNGEKDVLVSRDIIKVMAGTFLGEGGNPKDPLASPHPRRPERACRRSTSRSAATRRCSTTAGGWRTTPARRGSTSRSTSFPACSTSSTSWPAWRRRPTTRSRSWLIGCARSWVSADSALPLPALNGGQ